MNKPKYSEDKSFSLSLYELEGSPDDALNVFTNFIIQSKNQGLKQPYLSLDHYDNRFRIEGWVPMAKEKILKEKKEEKKIQEKIEKREREYYEKLKLKYGDK